MLLQFNAIALMLVVLIALGVVSNNSSVTIASTILLLMQQTVLKQYLPWVEKNGLSIGIVILTLGVLSPLVTGKVPLQGISYFFQWKMILAVIVGVIVAWLGGRGGSLMSGSPTLVTGLIVGTIIGVAFFGGIPVGPLIAAGLLSLVIGKG
ncbi:hypothetical protein CEP49_03465 [Mergibacter septicus]|uniref:DUF441 domain-containing protein n=1 Tax=Mergibacter septicus TaxID=221402 RepID=UPI00117923EA|nr:DUF441 domain-containing protein [Mergibacter septicus]AWX13678.1 hypothetical protein CEP49_03465 [Mergibacter septicus]